jgi:GDP-4-dehydro-6-deoxy-D-mannose reductase
MLQRLRALARTQFEICVDPDRVRASDVPCSVGDASKLRNATGWAPRRSLDDMLSRLLNHGMNVSPRETPTDGRSVNDARPAALKDERIRLLEALRSQPPSS